MESKVCSKCSETKPIERFHKRKDRKSGYDSMCKDCKNKYQRENHERFKERKKQHYQENREKILENKKKYQFENKEKISDRRRKHKLENGEYKFQKMQINEEGKICVKCGTWKEYAEFDIHKQCIGGYNSVCKECRKKHRQSRKEEISQHMKKYYKDNKEVINKKVKMYLQTERGREVMYQKSVRRRSHKHKVCFSPYQRKQILDRDNWFCSSCGIKVHDRRTGNWNTPDKAHIDHIIPISKGGNSEPKNLRTLCRTCNLSKHDKQNEQLNLFN